MNDDAENLVPGHPDFERSLAQGQFGFAKARYIRTLTATSVDRLLAAAASARAELTEEIRNMQVLSRARYESAVGAAREYAEILPHRVGKTWLQPPAGLEKIGSSFGSERFYKRAVKAAKEFTEAQQLLAKTRDRLALMERQLRERLDREGAVVERELATPRGLQVARLRDPLLDVAYKRLEALTGAADIDEIALATPAAAVPVEAPAPVAPSQYPEEPGEPSPAGP